MVRCHKFTMAATLGLCCNDVNNKSGYLRLVLRHSRTRVVFHLRVWQGVNVWIRWSSLVWYCTLEEIKNLASDMVN